MQKNMLKMLITSLWTSLITKLPRMYRHKKAMIIFVSFLMIPIFSNAQAVEEPENPLKTTLSATYVTQHYWRGIGRGKLFGEAPAFVVSTWKTRQRRHAEDDPLASLIIGSKQNSQY